MTAIPQLWANALPKDICLKCNDLLSVINKLRVAGHTIFPSQNRIFAALDSVAPDEVKAVILGQDPYFNAGEANGLAFSVDDGIEPPPSLKNIFKELCLDTGCAYPSSGNLDPWAKQGVLLLNANLTVEEGAPRSHKKLGWDVFTGGILRFLIASKQPIVFLCWGNPAADAYEEAKKTVSSTTAVMNKHCITSTHPSPRSAYRSSKTKRAFLGSRPFTQTNTFLNKEGQTPINWHLP